MSDKNEIVEVSYHEIIHETEKAYLMNIFNDGSDGMWIPKSQIEELDENSKTFMLPQWLAEEKELV